MISGHLFSGLQAKYIKDTQYKYRIAYRILSKVDTIVIPLVLAAIGLSACADQPTPFRPPISTIHATQTTMDNAMPASTQQVTLIPLPTATTICTNNLTFLEAVSIPDGTVVHPGERVDKRWLIQNSGSCNWDDLYRLTSVMETNLSTPAELALYPARSGAKANVQMLFIAPSQPGTYQGTWQAYNPQGQPFGDRLYLQIVVDSGTP